MGLIFLWVAAGDAGTRAGECSAAAPGLGTAAKWLAGFTQEREPPAFAREPSRPGGAGGRPRQNDATQPPVVLWPDTFSNNYFLPGTLKAAVTVLEDAGYRVHVPQQPLCCGRPLYDYGMLDLAAKSSSKSWMCCARRSRAGIPVVGLEPSCVSGVPRRDAEPVPAR